MERLVAALDADVLVPILCCDFLLTAFDLGLYEPVVSAETLAEVERNLVEDFPHLDPASLRRRVDQMRDVLQAHVIGTVPLDGAPKVINAKDRHVIAAALASEASVVVTNDKRLRTETEQADLDLVAMSADDFAAHLWRSVPDDVDHVIAPLVAKRTARPVSTAELVEALRSPFPAMAAGWSGFRSGGSPAT